MPPPRSTTAPQRSSPTLPRRLFGRWWRRQSPAQQDRFATLGPLVSVLLFLAALEQLLSEQGYKFTQGASIAAANAIYAQK